MTSTSTTAGQPTLSRRAFLRNAGFLVVAIGTSQLVNPRGVSAVLDDFPIGPLSVDPTQLDSWLAIDGSGGVTYFSGKEELGQGVATAVLQVVADELDVAPSSVRPVISDTWRTVDQGYTAGSQSLFTEYGPNGVRQACAEARAALLNMASAQLGAPAGSLIVANGIVSVAGAPARTVSYAQLVGGKKLNLPITGKATPK
ncbi:MAG: molybdopterin cofactor-binding domain-containing protein, partial [Gaiellaceae bacterium]